MTVTIVRSKTRLHTSLVRPIEVSHPQPHDRTATRLTRCFAMQSAATLWRIAVAILPLILGVSPLPAQELPPEIQVDRYMVQVDRQIRNEEFAAALRTLDRVLELYETYEIVIPTSFWMKRAEVAMGAERHVEAMESAARYLEVAGRDGEQYDEALDLLDRAFAQGCTPEAMTQSLESLKACLAHGADPNEPDASGRMPLHWAQQRDSPAITAALVEAGADSTAAVAVERAEAERMPDGPICTGDSSPHFCWMEIAGRAGCYLWAAPQGDVTVTWTGECSNGLAQGIGRTTWYRDHEVNSVWESGRVDGKVNGWVVGREGEFRLTEGCLVNNEFRGAFIRGDERSLRSGYYWQRKRSFSGGERVVINLKSDEFDAYLKVLRADGTVLATNDDGGSGTNARLVFEAPAAGDYWIRAVGYDDDATGPFVLWVGDRDPGTMNPGDACGPGTR